MKSTEIKHNVQNLIDNFSKEEFVFDLLMAYGISKTSVTRLKKGDYNLSKVDGEILYKKKIFFKVEATNKLLSSIEEIAKDERNVKHQPRFAILTDYKQLVAKDLKLGKNLDIKLKELPNYFDFFLPLAGSEVYNASNNNEADRNASYKMASLYDLLIEDVISVELKAVTKTEDLHLAQAINYLEAYNLEVGLLINFGTKSLEFKRFINSKFNQRNQINQIKS